MSIDEILSLVPPDMRDEAAESLKRLRDTATKTAISAVMARNMSHHLGGFMLNGKDQKKLA
ncbi:MAG: hypothetical protein WCG55_02570 [bacterium]